jgi:hypothetical protein
MSGLRGYDGKIMIDEGEASSDIRNIDEARSKLEAAIKLLDPAKIDRARMEGETRIIMENQLSTAVKKIRAQMENCVGTSSYIKDTVEKYRRIDRELEKKMRR